VAGFCERGDELSGSGATELVSELTGLNPLKEETSRCSTVKFRKVTGSLTLSNCRANEK
jgi:hypothetical protein